MHIKRYTEKEINIIKKYYPSGGAKEVRKYLPYRSEKSINNKANNLKVYSKNRKKFFTEQEVKIIEKYYPIGGAKEVRKYIPNRSEEVIRAKAKKLKIPSTTIYFTDYEDYIIKNYYPMGGWELVQNYIKRTKQSIQTRASNLGVKCLTYNENYFEIIDTADKAYWLGFIYADGYVTDKTKRFGIELSIKDKSHLENFVEALDSNLKIRERERITQISPNKIKTCNILINNSKLYNDLNKLGVYSDKTYNVKFPNYDKVPQKFMTHFIRGLIDGDGTIGIHNNKEYQKPHISLISANKHFLINLNKELNKYGINLNLTNNKKNLYILRSEKQDTVKKMVNLIYKDSNSKNRLNRKYQKAIEILKVFR